VDFRRKALDNLKNSGNELISMLVRDGSMVTVEYRASHGDGVTAESAWKVGTEIESSAAQRQPLTFEVGSRMALPVLYAY